MPDKDWSSEASGVGLTYSRSNFPPPFSSKPTGLLTAAHQPSNAGEGE